MTDSFVPRTDATFGLRRLGNPGCNPFGEPVRTRPPLVEAVQPPAERALSSHDARMRGPTYAPLHLWTVERFPGMSR